MDLTKIARPWTEDDAEIPCEWAQRELHGNPVIASRIDELTARIAVTSTRGTSALWLWDPSYEAPQLRELLAALQLPGDNYAVALSPPSRTPIETGYLEIMHLTLAKDGISGEAAITEFGRVQQDRYGDMERHLVECYGTLTPERATDVRFRTINYSGFDLGSVNLGLGLFIEHVQYRHTSIWCWSRVVNWHK